MDASHKTGQQDGAKRTTQQISKVRGQHGSLPLHNAPVCIVVPVPWIISKNGRAVEMHASLAITQQATGIRAIPAYRGPKGGSRRPASDAEPVRQREAKAAER